MLSVYNRFNWRVQSIDDIDDLQKRVEELGFLPMFECGVRGYSVYEATPQFWRGHDLEGPWEWKGPVIREGRCAYGKFFKRKATWISREWLPDFLNYRRSKRLAPNDDAAALDEVVLQTIETEGPVTSKELARMLGLSGRRAKRQPDDLVDETPDSGKVSLDPILTRLMMEGRVVIADFIYNIDRRGNRYGWGVAKYAVPEQLYGDLRVDRTPEESYWRIMRHLSKIIPTATGTQLRKLLG